MASSPVITAHDTALLLEGGGMRAAYSAGVVDVLMSHGVQFGWAGGISAGASHLVSYLTGERDRLRRNFVDFVLEPEFGGWSHLLRGRGFFNAEYIYGRAPGMNLPRPYDFGLVAESPTQFRIGATRADTGEGVYWGLEDIAEASDLLIRVRASSTIPFAMPVPRIDGVPYADGAFGSSGGVPLDAAEADGYDRFFAVLTQPRGYFKDGISRPRLTKAFLRRWPGLADAMVTRHERYNATMERLYELEAQGKAVLVFPEDSTRLVSSTERDIRVLRSSMYTGVAQALRQWPEWAGFLGADAPVHSLQR